MFSRLSAWITARSVPAGSAGRIVLLAPKKTLLAAGDWLDDLAATVGPLTLGVTDAERDGGLPDPGGDRPAVALPPELALERLARLQPRAVVVIGPVGELGSSLATISAPRLWVNAEGDASTDIEWAEVFAARDQACNAPGARVIGDPIAGAVDLPAAPAPDTDFCERFREYHEKGHPILLAPNTGPGEEAFAFAVLFAVLRKTAAILLLAPADRERHEPVYRDAIKYSLPIIRHNRFMTSFVPRKNRVYYIEDPDTLHSAYGCAHVTLPGGTLAASETPPDLGLPLAHGSAVICGPAENPTQPDAATRLRLAAEHTGLVSRCSTPEEVADEVLARLAESRTAQDRRDDLAQWQQRQANARSSVRDALTDSLANT
ncbi:MULTISPECIES: hypothetical protein [unclassified Thioalkalivibrio]|uniref:hypothetical protein n=1 Tax=unclassified Thioalkalivibrio TaxID=2621013 RepID=UPI000361C1D2|nr:MULTISPECIES: hypothetical protein [unclassified Thioalkalivibrio]